MVNLFHEHSGASIIGMYLEYSMVVWLTLYVQGIYLGQARGNHVCEIRSDVLSVVLLQQCDVTLIRAKILHDHVVFRNKHTFLNHITLIY